MKKCIKNCGIYEDYESVCPMCGSRLLRVNASDCYSGGHNQTSYVRNNTSSTEQMSDNRQNEYKTTSQSGFSYDTHIYGMKSDKSINGQRYSDNSNTQNTYVQSSMKLRKNEFRGKVKNLREDNRSMKKGESFFYSLKNGTIMTNSEKNTSFQLVELDENNNPTGIIYSVTFRGDIVVGHFYDGNIVVVGGKRARSGEVYARNIYNETTSCYVKIRAGMF